MQLHADDPDFQPVAEIYKVALKEKKQIYYFLTALVTSHLGVVDETVNPQSDVHKCPELYDIVDLA